ncbi:MAG: alpha/beta-type small acid-soluble spore protein [Christensenellaceae bacterium]|nr:alpha/beta-type small acid-soluble spore protein [Christensenellaceae bacterium]
MDTSKQNVSNAKEKMNTMKYEVANQLGINLKQGYNGDLTSKEAGYVGGYMVKRMIEDVERRNSGK